LRIADVDELNVGVVDRLLVADREPAGSQLDHGFPEPGGTRRSREDSKEAAFEFTKPTAEPAGQPRTRPGHGSGP